MNFRIGIVGCAGTGKSALAEVVASHFKVPNLTSRDITETILKRDGYDYGSGIQIERFLANTGRQNEILRMTVEQQSGSDFVTDRTVVDLASYAVCEMHHSDPAALRRIIEMCQKKVSIYTHLFLCPWKDIPVASTGKRTLNPWYQYLIHITERGIMDEWGCKYVILNDDDKGKRLQAIVSSIVGC